MYADALLTRFDLPGSGLNWPLKSVGLGPSCKLDT